MKITTKSGAVYTIKGGICYKVGSDGYECNPFKVIGMKAVPLDVRTIRDVHITPVTEPEVGKLLYIWGLRDDWLSTEVVSIEGEKE
jgi:hypothetical protein